MNSADILPYKLPLCYSAERSRSVFSFFIAVFDIYHISQQGSSWLFLLLNQSVQLYYFLAAVIVIGKHISTLLYSQYLIRHLPCPCDSYILQSQRLSRKVKPAGTTHHSPVYNVFVGQICTWATFKCLWRTSPLKFCIIWLWTTYAVPVNYSCVCV